MYCKSFKNATLGQRLQVNYFFLKLAHKYSYRQKFFTADNFDLIKKKLMADYYFWCRSYSYYVDVSMDQKDWVRVIDYTKYLCRSWQELYFTPRVVKYIRIVGTFNTLNKVFHLVSLEAYYTKKPCQFDKNGILSKY